MAELVDAGITSNTSQIVDLNYYYPSYPNIAPIYWPTVVVPCHCPSTPRCAWCQGEHVGKCERLKSVKYREDGTVECVEFYP